MKILLNILTHLILTPYCVSQSLVLIELNEFEGKDVDSYKYDTFYNEDSSVVDIRLIINGNPPSEFMYKYSKTKNGAVEIFAFSGPINVKIDDKLFLVKNPFPNVYLYKEPIEITGNCDQGSVNKPKILNKKGYTLIEDYNNQSREYCVLNDTNGTFKRYVQNNIVYKEGYILNNKKHNVWKYFDSNGVLKEVEVYNNGELIDSKMY